MINQENGKLSPTGPLYARVQQSLREAIQSGTLPAGATLPSEKELEIQFGVSRITVRRALDELEREGLVERGRGRQARVATLLTAAISTRIEDDLASILQLGREMKAEVLSYMWRMPEPSIAERLGTPPEEPVLQVERLRRRFGQPMLHTLAHVPAAIGAHLPRNSLETSTMLDLLATWGIQVGSVEQEMRAAPCATDISQLLDVHVDAPVFLIDRLVRDGTGRPIQCMLATFRCDCFRYRVTTTRLDNGKTLGIEAAGQIDTLAACRIGVPGVCETG